MVLTTVQPSMWNKPHAAAALIGDFDGTKSHQNVHKHIASDNFQR